MGKEIVEDLNTKGPTFLVTKNQLLGILQGSERKELQEKCEASSWRCHASAKRK